MAHVMEDSMRTHDERQWEGLEEMMARSAAGEVAIPELEIVAAEPEMEEEPVAAFRPGLLGQGWGWSCTAPEMAAGVGVNWCPTPPRSPEREASPREEVVQAPPAVQPAPSTMHRRPTCGRRWPTSTSSATTKTPAATEDGDGDGDGIDGHGQERAGGGRFSFLFYV